MLMPQLGNDINSLIINRINIIEYMAVNLKKFTLMIMAFVEDFIIMFLLNRSLNLNRKVNNDDQQ